MPQYGHESGKQNADGNSVVVVADEDGDVFEVNQDGSASVRIVDPHENHVDISFIRTLSTHTPLRVVGTGFIGTTVDTNFWTVATNGTGASASQTTRHLTLASGTANEGYASLQSVQVARFVFAHPLVYRSATSVTDTTVAGNTRRWGVFTETGTPPTPVDGFFFELDEAGVLSINYADGGSVTKVESGSFNGAVSAYTLDTNVHAFEIQYFLMKVSFLIDDVEIHSIDTSDLTDEPIGSYTLPIRATSVNAAGGTASGALVTHAAVIMRQGRYDTAPVSKYQSGTTAGLVLKRGPGIIHRVTISGVAQNSAITIYDNTAASGTILWSSGSMGSQTQPFGIELGVTFFTGLTLVIAAANSTVTVVYE